MTSEPIQPQYIQNAEKGFKMGLSCLFFNYLYIKRPEYPKFIGAEKREWDIEKLNRFFNIPFTKTTIHL